MFKTKETYPIGKVVFFFNKKKYIALASLIYYKNTPMVITAAHCIFDWFDQSYCESIYFIYKRKKIILNKAYLHKDWVKSGTLDYDTACLNIKNVKDLDTSTKINPIFNLNYEQTFTIGFQRLRILNFKDRISFKDTMNYSSLIGVNLKIKVGSSGGPWFLKKDGIIYQNSNSSFSFKDNKNIIWGPYWGNEIKDLFNACFNKHKNNSNILTHEFNYSIKGGDIFE